MIDTPPLAGRHCVVVGAAPLAAPIVFASATYVVAVNGGIGSCHRVDAWVLNSRNIHAASWSPAQSRLSRLMLAQGADRTVPLVVLLIKHDDAGEWTRRYLAKQGTKVAASIELSNPERRALETAAGARTSDMAKQALSAGLFAAAWCFHRGATVVRLEGFSWEGGYAYLPGERFPTRGHTSGDRDAIRRLSARYPGRLIQSLVEENDMAKTPIRTAPPRPPVGRPAAARPSAAAPANRPTAEGIATAREGRASAKDALTPAAELARKVERKRLDAAIAARPRGNAHLRVRATELTFYNNKRRKPGEVFDLREATDYRESCMEWAGTSAPLGAAPPPPVNAAPPAGEVEDPDEAALDETLSRRRDATRRPGKVTDDNPLGIE